MADAVVSEVARVYKEIVRAVRNCQDNLAADDDLILEVAAVRGVRVELFGIQQNMLSFDGRDGAGRKVLVVQHYSQANVILTAGPRPKGVLPARPIGFLGSVD
jgi:hypothetical protein